MVSVEVFSVLLPLGKCCSHANFAFYFVVFFFKSIFIYLDKCSSMYYDKTSIFKSTEGSTELLYRPCLFFCFFFSGKSLKVCSLSTLIFRGLTRDSFLSSMHIHCEKEGKLRYRTAKV